MMVPRSGQPVTTFIPYTTRVSGRARRCRILIRGREVTLVVPRRMALSDAEAFLRSQEPWIQSTLNRIAREETPLCPADTVLFRGQPMPLRVTEQVLCAERAVVREEGGALHVHVRLGAVHQVPCAARAWLRRQARRVLENELRAQSDRTGLRPRALAIRNQRTRWGSCSCRGTISLNWRLIMAPPEVLSYVVIHELCHLAEANHGPRFWRLVGTWCPAFREHRAWLRRYSRALMSA